jgi:hypothetical protein
MPAVRSVVHPHTATPPLHCAVCAALPTLAAPLALADVNPELLVCAPCNAQLHWYWVANYTRRGPQLPS